MIPKKGHDGSVRAGRLVSLLLILQRRGRVTAAELALDLEVSERTILRDLDELSGAGVPVFATRGPGGGFELLEGYEPTLTDPASWTADDPAGKGRRPNRNARCRIRISPEGRRLAAVLGRLQPLRIRRAIEADAEGWVEASFRLRSDEAAIIDLMSLSPHVEVLAPAPIRSAVAERLDAALALHSTGGWGRAATK